MNFILKKSRRYLYYFLKKVSTINGYSENSDGAIFLNTFAKSGTHLLSLYLEQLEHKSNLGEFLVDYPSITLRKAKESSVVDRIKMIRPNEISLGHLFYSKERSKVLSSRNVKTVFLYRDPRDVSISEAFYLRDMNKFHKMHKYFKNLANIDDAIMFSIMGNEYIETPYFYPNIVERFNKYKGWFDDSEVFSIKFEELRDPELSKLKIIELLEWLELDFTQESPEDLFYRLHGNIDSMKSHTLRSGKIQQWKSKYNQDHLDAFERVGGSFLLNDLGY